MKKFHIRIVGGWCGNRMVMIRENLAKLLAERGYEVKLDQQSIWENSAAPLHVDLVLQLISAFSTDELNCPSLNIRPFLKDLDHQETIENIIVAMEAYYPTPADQTTVKNPFAAFRE
jgi:galactitol-specific phosphotransferase system IIB component